MYSNNLFRTIKAQTVTLLNLNERTTLIFVVYSHLQLAKKPPKTNIHVQAITLNLSIGPLYVPSGRWMGELEQLVSVLVLLCNLWGGIRAIQEETLL